MKIRMFTFSLILIASSVNSASANNEAPRISYLTQMCHNSTAAIVKMSLRKNMQNVDDFCGCVAKKAVTQHAQKNDHAYALEPNGKDIRFTWKTAIRVNRTLMRQTESHAFLKLFPAFGCSLKAARFVLCN